MGKFDFLKGFGKAFLPVAKQLFPVIGLVEQLSKFKQLSSKEKQDLGFELMRDELIKNLLPDQVEKFSNDSGIEERIRKIIDAQVDLINYAKSLSEK
jgi:hypothetical protein